MSSGAFIALICGAIIALLLGRTLWIMRQERGQGRLRGSDPGKGTHTIHAEYSSGISGHSTSYEVPRDPQEYAKLFVPKETDTDNDR